jgi:hypothetical protein
VPIFKWKRERAGVHVCNEGDDVAGGSVVRLAKDDWRVYAFGGGIANAPSLGAGKRVLESALARAAAENPEPEPQGRTRQEGATMSKKKSGPISPDEIGQIRSAIPDEVFDAFNEAIAANWDGHSATIKQYDVATAALAKLQQRLPHMTREQMYQEHWLDVEPAYEAKGWHVRYDKPAYNETYPPVFIFKRKSR